MERCRDIEVVEKIKRLFYQIVETDNLMIFMFESFGYFLQNEDPV